MADEGSAPGKMAAHHDLESGVRRLTIHAAALDDAADEVSTRRQSEASSEDSWQSPNGLHTPASSLFSEDFETEPKPRQRSTVIHEEAESSASWSNSPGFTMDALVAAERQEYGHGDEDEEGDETCPTTPPESPVLPPADIVSAKSKRVRQAVEYSLPYTHPTMPWDKFYSSRADYPSSMFESFLHYHRGPLDVLHDLGAGSGLAADGLLTALRSKSPTTARASPARLPRTILSDPGKENLSITARFVRARHPDVVTECWRARGEDQHQFLAPSSVDMTICAEALHWMDMPLVVSQVAHSLRPGGTFAVLLYSCFPRILNNAHAKKALRALIEHHLRTRLLKSHRRGSSAYEDDDDDDDDDNNNNNNNNNDQSNGDPTSDPGSPTTSTPLHANWARGMRFLAYGLDAVELPADQWEAIKRFEINCGTTGWWWPSASKDVLGCAAPMADASPHERSIYESYDDWGRWASLRELKELLISIQVGFGDKTWESPLWKELEKSVKGPLHLIWQTHMILARKKGPRLETVPEES